MHRTRKHLTAIMALFALLGAQVFGLQRGYVCLCSGEAIETIASSCEEDTNCGDHEHEGVPHDHAPLKVKHEAQSKAASTPQVQAPVVVAILDLKDIISLYFAPPIAETVLGAPPPGRDANPPASLQVAECTVLLI